MELKTLKYLRVLVPGFIILIGMIPIKEQIIKNYSYLKSIDYNYVVLLAIVLGAIYYQLNISHLITKLSHHIINKNIFNKLMKYYGELSSEKKKIIWNEKFYRNIFYKITDNDETLKRKVELVYFNGIFWTSSADLCLISLIYWFIYKYNVFSLDNINEFSTLFLYIALLALFLHIITIIKHFRLSNNQLEFIEKHKIKELKKSVDEVL
jgi:hypothetical protein